jgi:hypothetical protein
MIRRLLGALLCLLVISAATFDAYADAARKDTSFTLQFEPSYTSLDPVEDAGDPGYPDGIVNWSPREKIVTKLILTTGPRKMRFMPPMILLRERFAHSRLTTQEILRYQEVFRI